MNDFFEIAEDGSTSVDLTRFADPEEFRLCVSDWDGGRAIYLSRDQVIDAAKALLMAVGVMEWMIDRRPRS